MQEDSRLTIQETATDVKISIGTVYSVLTENLHLRKVSVNLCQAANGATNGTMQVNFRGRAEF